MSAGRIAVGLVLGGLLAGCGGGAGIGPAVGAVEGTDAVLGVVASAGQVKLYVCGGASSFATMTRWFSGAEAAEGGVALEKDGWNVTAEPDLLAGTLAPPGGAPLAWSAHAASPGTPEGLYAVLDGGCRTGAVVFQPDGAGELRFQGTWCGDGDRFAQVTPIVPVELTARSIPIRVELPESPRELLLSPLETF